MSELIPIKQLLFNLYCIAPNIKSNLESDDCTNKQFFENEKTGTTAQNLLEFIDCNPFLDNFACAIFLNLLCRNYC